MKAGVWLLTCVMAGCGGVGAMDAVHSTASHDDTRILVNRQVQLGDPDCQIFLVEEVVYTDAAQQVFKVEYDAKIDGAPETVIYSMVPPAASDPQDDALRAELYGEDGKPSFTVLVSGKNHELTATDGSSPLIDVRGYGHDQDETEVAATGKIADQSGLTLLGCAIPARLPDPQLAELSTPRFLDNVANTAVLGGDVAQVSENPVPIDPQWPADMTVLDAVRLMGGLTATGFRPGCWPEQEHNVGWCP